MQISKFYIILSIYNKFSGIIWHSNKFGICKLNKSRIIHVTMHYIILAKIIDEILIKNMDNRRKYACKVTPYVVTCMCNEAIKIKLMIIACKYIKSTI